MVRSVCVTPYTFSLLFIVTSDISLRNTDIIRLKTHCCQVIKIEWILYTAFINPLVEYLAYLYSALEPMLFDKLMLLNMVTGSFSQ